MLNTVKKKDSEHQPVKIGMLLVNEGFVRKADIDKAIRIQDQEAKLAVLPIGKILLKQGVITKPQLQILLEHPKLQERIGDFAVENGRISEFQLAECKRRKPDHVQLDEALVKEGHLTSEDLKTFLELQLDSPELCRLATRLGMVPEEKLNDAIKVKRYPRAIGEILCDLNLITPLDLNTVLAKHNKHLRLGEILLKQDIIDSGTLERTLAENKDRNEPLGNLLLEKNLITRDQLFEAFAVQYNIPFERLEGFSYSESDRRPLMDLIGATFARQFKIVPLTLSEPNLTVAIADPEQLRVVQSLRSKRVDLRTDCVLVTDSVLNSLFEGLYQQQPPAESTVEKPSRIPFSSPALVHPPPAARETPPLPEVQPAESHNSIQTMPALTLFSPETQNGRIRRFHQLYDEQIRQAGVRKTPSNPTVFESFITSKYQQICHQYRCNRVVFSTMRNNDTLIIVAAPQWGDTSKP
ncbi:MAG: hypothetical protein JRH15_03510 [Deltaproteobacteria bacterium]|nr:hypothetical protein [Deltaproteobacteria bacterium]